MVIPKALRKNIKITAIIWAGCLVFFVLIYMLFLAPQGRARKKLENELKEKKQMYEFAQSATREETRDRLLEQIGDLRNDLGVFATDFENSADLIFDISRIAREKNVASLNVENQKDRIGPAVDVNKNISENRISVSFVAGFNQFASFLNALERHKPVLFVNGFKLIRSNQDQSAYQIEMDVAALIKKQQENNVTAKSEQPGTASGTERPASDEKI